jgi:hypothetical protein
MLGAPEIQGILSECSRGVGFHQLVVGATVKLQTAASVVIGQWTVVNAEQDFDFDPGKVLKKGESVQAMQFTAGESGQLSQLVTVNGHPAPTDLNAGAFAKPLFECGECVWLYGLFAGADVQVANNLDDVIGKGVVRPDGTVEVGLSRPLRASDQITAKQTACASVGGPITTTIPINGGTPVALAGITLPQTLVHPIKRCDTALYIEKIVDGASIEITRNPKGGPPETFPPQCIPTQPFTLWGFAPFQTDEVVVIETDMHACKIPVGTKVVLPVDSTPLGAPTILNTICTDTLEIVIGGLELNALVEIGIHHPGTPTTIHYGASAPQDSFSIAVGTPPLPVQTAGAQITVRQNLCGGPGDWSATTSTTVQAVAAKPPNLFTPFNLEMNVSLTTFLRWNDAGTPPCSQASGYDVRVSKSLSMAPADLVFAPKLTIVPNTIAIPSGVLQGGVMYFWQVRAFHPGNPFPSGWSNIFQFTTLKPAAPPPGGGGGGGGEQTFYFCQTCPGFDSGSTITVVAPDYATAEAIATKNLPSGCFLSPGRCT